MTSLLKNQILKHLSRFTKNLSPDKISLSALRGEGELANLELDETVLMDILELPTWLKLSKAICNRVAIKIQWTKLKTQPICLYLDEVVLEVETCEEPRPPNNPMVSSNIRPGKYGFVERAIDGIYVHINSVQVYFRSKTFQASLQMSRVKVHSVTPTWQGTSDLRLTRIKDISRGEVIIFKEVDWQATRIEAQAVDPMAKGVITQTPIRLIANQAKLRIAVKKNLNDCSIVSSRVILLLDDLLWVLTETQMKAALLYATSLQEVIEKSTRQSKQLAAEKLKKQGHIAPDQLKRLQMMKQKQGVPTSKASRVFARFEVLSTSYHLITSRIDLHLCDDMQPRKDSSPTHNSKIEGGAMQVTLNKLSLDYYPFNPADEKLVMSRGGERKQWYRYSDQVGTRNLWVGQLFAGHKKAVQKAKIAFRMSSPSQSPSHISDQSSTASFASSSSLSSAPGSSSKVQMSPTVSSASEKSPVLSSSSSIPQGRPPQTGSGGGEKKLCLLESCIVLEIDEFTIFCISTADNKRNNPHKFFSSEKKVLHLPHDMPIFHMEYTEYYYPEGVDLPVPHANLYALLNPVQLRVDYLTLLWANYFLLQLYKNLKEGIDGPREHIDFKFEALMPKILIPAESGSHNQVSERPDTLLIQVSKMSATNSHTEAHATHEKLLAALADQNKCNLFKSTEFPMDYNQLMVCPQHVCTHVLDSDFTDAYIDTYVKQILQNHKNQQSQVDPVTGGTAMPDRKRLRTNSLKLDAAYDIWNVDVDQIWMDFTTRKSRPVPFLESFPVTFWFWRTLSCKKKDTVMNGERDIQMESHKMSNYSNSKLEDFDLQRTNSHSEMETSSCDKAEASRCTSDSSYSTTSTTTTNGDFTDSPSANHTDIYGIACIRTKVQVLLTHYQYLFLLRLTESLTTFQKQLNADTEYFSGNSVPSSISLTTFLQDVEIAMVFKKPAESSYQGGNMTGGQCRMMKGSTPELSLGERENVVDGWPNNNSCNYDGNVTYISKSYSDSRLNLSKHENMNGELRDHLSHGDSIQPLDISLESSTSNLNLAGTDGMSDSTSPISSVVYSAASDSVYSTISSQGSSDSKAAPTRKASFKTEKKKGLSTAWSTFTDKLRSMSDLNDESLMGSEDSEPGQTDYSSDDESFEHLSLEDAEELPAFERKGALEAQSSFDTLSQDSSLETTSTAREKLQITVTVFHVSNTEVLVQNSIAGTVVQCQLDNVDVIESGGLTWEGFHRKFTSSKGLPYETELMSKQQFPVRLKYMIGPGLPELKYDLIGQERGFLHVDVGDIHMTFQMSTLINLAEMMEDEVPPVFMPLYVNIEDLTLTLQEDRPSSCGLNAQPDTVISLHRSIIDRGGDGVFHIRGATNGKSRRRQPVSAQTSEGSLGEDDDIMDIPSSYSAVSNNTRIIEQLSRRNENLKLANDQQAKTLENYNALLTEISDLKVDNQNLKESIEADKAAEIERSKHCLSPEQIESIEHENLKLLQKTAYLEEELQTSIKEKDSLLATMHLLQEELLASEQQRIFQHHASPNK